MSSLIVLCLFDEKRFSTSLNIPFEGPFFLEAWSFLPLLLDLVALGADLLIWSLEIIWCSSDLVVAVCFSTSTSLFSLTLTAIYTSELSSIIEASSCSSYLLLLWLCLLVLKNSRFWALSITMHLSTWASANSSDSLVMVPGGMEESDDLSRGFSSCFYTVCIVGGFLTLFWLSFFFLLRGLGSGMAFMFSLTTWSSFWSSWQIPELLWFIIVYRLTDTLPLVLWQ